MAIFSAQWASTLVELPTLTFHHAILPLSIFSALHGIRVSMAYRQAIEQAAAQSLRDGKDPQPARILLGMPPSWLGSNVVVPTYALSFVLIQYTYLYEILKDMVPPAVLDTILIAADGSLRALSIAKLGVDGSRMRFAADSHYPGAASEPWFAMLLLGMIAGSGGGMWGDFLKLKSHKWTLSTPSFASAATFDMKAALLSAFFYAASTSPQFYNLLHNAGRADKENFIAHGGMLESQDAKGMTMLVMCTLLLGKRAEETVVQLSKSFQSNTSTIPPRKSLRSSTAAAASKKHDDDVEEEGDDEVSDRHELKRVSKLDRDEDSKNQPLIRRGFDDATEEEDEEEEEQQLEEEVKKSTRGGRKKASTTTTTTTTTSRKSTKAASVEPSSSDVPLTRSTRLRKPTRQEL
ncbi:hypothetical protein BGZ95_007554 [Linnemannia exigua]|uniref:Uncharacterized protein n=1 Tax=Linnemannia exigua TaxID=604196 RepID=A0AAD4DEY8_9FUNG|nr:hypothetical protein BGZ95_007554 [Linnemannia exigua]